MKRIVNATEKFKKIHKNDIINFFETLIGDKNIDFSNPEVRLTVSSANYKRNRSLIMADETIKSNIEKTLTIKFSVNKPKKTFFEFILVRNGDFTTIHRSLSIYWNKNN